MEDKKTIQSYINNFRRHLSGHLKPGVGLSCNVYPSKEQGAVLEFNIGPNLTTGDLFKPSSESVNSVLKSIPQKIVGGNIDAIKFVGTNISMEQSRIIIIKGENDPSLWDDNSAKDDVDRILSSYPRVG